MVNEETERLKKLKEIDRLVKKYNIGIGELNFCAL
jgi:hypothetical protein